MLGNFLVEKSCVILVGGYCGFTDKMVLIFEYSVFSRDMFVFLFDLGL